MSALGISSSRTTLRGRVRARVTARVRGRVRVRVRVRVSVRVRVRVGGPYRGSGAARRRRPCRSGSAPC